MSSQILLVEDEPGLVFTLSDLLRNEGFDVQTAANGEAGLARALTGNFDLIILDVMLPKKSGFDVCRELRQRGCEVAILMLTARSQVTDRVTGLKIGADDYVPKPFEPSELLARIQALLRRVSRENRAPVRTFEFDGVHIDFESGEVRKNGAALNLATKELQLLRYLIDQRGKVVPREELLQNVWGYQSDVASRTIDVHIAWLRQKLEDQPQNPRHIHTIRGRGYRFSE